MTLETDNLLIVGAGFSRNAGLPLAGDFTQALLDLRGRAPTGPSRKQVDYIKSFVNSVFGEGESRRHDQWPELEDIFTLVDLSANSGHHLGPKYAASDLRVVRRAILVRMIRMLKRSYELGLKKQDDDWAVLEKFFSKFNPLHSSVLSMNWDTVFEQGLERTQNINNVEYGCGALRYKFVNGRLVPRAASKESVTVLKPHGSVNWLYCDACRDLFWINPKKTEYVAQTLFRVRDWDAVSVPKQSRPRVLEPNCPKCKANSLGTRFATFSYRKALDFPMHAASWRTAEHLLKSATNWIFFGYSMPSADFDFKNLLKRVQLSQPRRPKITLITKGGASGATAERYYKFFGDVPGERFMFRDGLDPSALRHLESIGLLNPG